MNWYLKVLKQHYADFNGRARRQEYWMFVLVNVLVMVVLAVLAKAVSVLGILYPIYALATLLPTYAAGVRRLHDIGKSGWLLLLAFVPLACLYLVYLLAQDSQAGANAYGPNPKAL